MSLGSKIVPVRFPDDLFQRMKLVIENRNHHSPRSPISISDYIREAVIRDIAHKVRSRIQRREKKL